MNLDVDIAFATLPDHVEFSANSDTESDELSLSDVDGKRLIQGLAFPEVPNKIKASRL